MARLDTPHLCDQIISPDGDKCDQPAYWRVQLRPNWSRAYCDAHRHLGERDPVLLGWRVLKAAD